MPLEEIAKYFALDNHYLFDLVEPYDFWLLVPVLEPDGLFSMHLLNPDGDWHLFQHGLNCRSIDEAKRAGKVEIDIWMNELSRGL